MNTRSCERVNGLAVVLRGYLSMVGELAGDQWNEGDVSCSVVRRVALPDAFFASDGLFQTFLTVLDEFGAYPAVIAARARPLPAVPGHHQGADGRGPARGRAGRPRTRRSRSTRSAVALDDAREGRGRQRPVRPARRRRAARADPRPSSTRWSPSRSRSPAPRSSRCRPSYGGSTRSSRRIPTPRRTPPPRSSSAAGRGAGAATRGGRGGHATRSSEAVTQNGARGTSTRRAEEPLQPFCGERPWGSATWFSLGPSIALRASRPGPYRLT